MPDSTATETNLSPVIRDSDTVATDVIINIDRTIVELVQQIDQDFYSAINKAHSEVVLGSSEDTRLVKRPKTDFTEQEAKSTSNVVDILDNFYGISSAARQVKRLALEKLKYAEAAAAAAIRKKTAEAFNDGLNKIRNTDAVTGVEATLKKKANDWIPKSIIRPKGIGRKERLAQRTGSDQLTADQNSFNASIESSNVLRVSTGNDWLWGSNHPSIRENKELNFKPQKVLPSDPILNKIPLPFFFIDVRSDSSCFFNATISSLSDSFSSNWSRESYFGRTEGISKYVNTDRELAVSFTIIAEDSDDLEAIYEKLTWLSQATYPKYKNNDTKFGYETSPIIRMRIGDLIKYENTGLGGYITSLNYDFDLNAGWEITKVGKKVPKKIDVSLSFTVIHDFMPDFSSNSKYYNVRTR